MSVAELKAHFSEALKSVLAGEEIGILYGKKKEIVAKLVPESVGNKSRRKLGVLEGRGTIKFAEDFKLSEEDFISLG